MCNGRRARERFLLFGLFYLTPVFSRGDFIHAHKRTTAARKRGGFLVFSLFLFSGSCWIPYTTASADVPSRAGPLGWVWQLAM